MSNFSFENVINTAKNTLENSKSDRVRDVFTNTRIIEGIKQPKNILRLLTSTRFVDNGIPYQRDTNEEGIYAECQDQRCNLCHKGYIQQCSEFITDNGVTWYIKSHINCDSKYVLYYLKCNMCQTERVESYTGKTETTLRTRMNNHISDCRTGNTTDMFDLHVRECGIKNQCFKPPYFSIYAFMKLRSPDMLLTYEKWLHGKRYDSMNK